MIGMKVMSVEVQTTNNRTRTPEEITDLVLSKLISIADTAPPIIKEQTIEYKERIRKLIAYYINGAILEERASCATLVAPISEEAASLIWRK